MKIIILILLLIQISFSLEVKTNNYNGFIFSSDYEFSLFRDSSIRVDLDSEDIEKAEELLFEFIRIKNEKIFGKLAKYKRQYFGITNIEGQKIVYINFITLWEPRDRSWKRDFFLVCDGGDEFFQLKVNLDTGECFDFFVNGIA